MVKLFKKIHDKFIKPLFLPVVDVWIATSKDELAFVKKYIGKRSRGKILKIPLGINKDIAVSQLNVENFITKNNLDGKFIISYVGRINKRKGVQFILRALSRLKDIINDVVFLIIGPDDGYLNKIQLLIQELNLNENVKCLGYLEKNNEQLYAAYASSNLLIVPSKYENFGHIFVEAGVIKTPIITSARYTDVFDKKDVYFFDFGNIDALAESILHVFNNQEESKQKAEKYHQKIMKMDSWEDMTRKYEKIYKKLPKPK